jgi:CBS domain-containing protein
MPVVHEIAGFLRAFPPFDTASEQSLEAVVAATQIEFFAAGAYVLRAGDPPTAHAYVIRTGHAELIDGGRVVDLLGPGDLVGLPSMLSDLPPGLDVRAEEDLLVYRVEADAIRPLLAGRHGLRFVAQTVRSRTPTGLTTDLLTDAAAPALADLARQAVVVTEAAPLREVVQLMSAQDASSAVVTCDDGSFGILTDHDLRNRVLAAGRDLDDPVSAVMTRGALTVRADSAADDASQLMLAHGVRHLPVLDADGTLLGVVEEVDLLAAQERAPSRLRRAIGRASDVEQLKTVSGALVPGLIEAYRAGGSPDKVTGSYSVLAQSLLSRAIALVLADRDVPPAPFVWLVTGSAARGEMVLSSDVDSLLAWQGSDTDDDIRRWMHAFAADVLEVVAACGLPRDTNGVTADDPRFARSVDAWRAGVRRWAADPTARQGAIYLSALFDARTVWGDHVWLTVRRELDLARRTPLVPRVLGRSAAAHRIPSGFTRGLVIEASGEHRGTLDLKAGGLTPIVDIGRHLWALGGAAQLDTLARLESARATGALAEGLLDDLRQAFLFLTSLRLDHQVRLVTDGSAPDDHVSPNALSGLSRRHLRDALRVVARAQRQLEVEAAGPFR